VLGIGRNPVTQEGPHAADIIASRGLSRCARCDRSAGGGRSRLC
jgi:hypothetical protein